MFCNYWLSKHCRSHSSKLLQTWCVPSWVNLQNFQWSPQMSIKLHNCYENIILIVCTELNWVLTSARWNLLTYRKSYIFCDFVCSSSDLSNNTRWKSQEYHSNTLLVILIKCIVLLGIVDKRLFKFNFAVHLSCPRWNKILCKTWIIHANSLQIWLIPWIRHG